MKWNGGDNERAFRGKTWKRFSSLFARAMGERGSRFSRSLRDGVNVVLAVVRDEQTKQKNRTENSRSCSEDAKKSFFSDADFHLFTFSSLPTPETY